MEKQLLELLDSDDNKKYYRYLLIDTLTTVSEMDFIAVNNIKDFLGEQSITTVIRPDLAYDLDSCPKLITIGKPNQQLEKRLVHFSVVEATDEVLHKKRYVASWMVSEYPPEIVVEQIVNIGLFLTKYYGNRFVPFYEPFKMQLLHQSNLICPEFVAEALKCFKFYIYPTINQTINFVCQLDYQPESIDVFLSEEAKFYQQQAGSIFDLYKSQSKIYHQIGKSINNINLIDLADAYRQAYFCGFTKMNDLFFFSLMTLRYGDLLSNPYFRKVINEAVNDGESLSKRFMEIDRKHFLSNK